MAEALPPELMSPAEIHRLTDYARPGPQAAWLKEKGIAYRLDGKRVILSRVHVRAWLEGRPVVQSSGLNRAAIR